MELPVGIIGAGVMGAEHARILRNDTPGAVLAGVYDADPARAQSAAGKVADIYGSAEELIGSAHVQAVVIASPDATHAALVQRCIAAGKPVLCEKPLGVTVDEAQGIVEAEVAVGRRYVQTGFMRRFDPGFSDLARRIRDQQLGAPLLVHNIHRNAVAPDWYTAEMSVSNALVHEIDTTRWLLSSEIESVQLHASATGDPLLALFRMSCGVMATNEVFMNCAYGYHVASQVIGSAGMAETVDPAASRLHANGAMRQEHPQVWVPRFRDAYRNQLAAWTAAIRSGSANDGASAWDGFVNALVAEAALRSLCEKAAAEVTIPPRPQLYQRAV